MADKPTPAPTEPSEDPVSLQDYCLRKSESLRRPELLAGFFAAMNAEGTTFGTRKAFDAALEKFRNTPV